MYHTAQPCSVLYSPFSAPSNNADQCAAYTSCASYGPNAAYEDRNHPPASKVYPGSYAPQMMAHEQVLRVPTPAHNGSMTDRQPSVCSLQMNNFQSANDSNLDVRTAGIESTLERFPPTIPHDLPIGVVCSPFAEDPPVVDVEGGIERCRKCHAYANAFVNFPSIGQAWKCPFCNTNNTAEGYMNPSSPQYTEGAVDFATYKQPHMKSAPKPACVFLLDSSALAVAYGALAHAARAIRNALDELEKNRPDALVSVMAFDADVYFFDIRTRFPKMIAVSSHCDDIFSPENAHLLMPLCDAREGIVAVLEYLDTLRADTAPSGNCLLNALKCATSLMEPHGGNLVVLTTAYPSCGSEASSPLVHERMSRAEFKPANNLFRQCSVEASAHKISVNAFVVADKFCDVASLWPLTSVGGRLRHYAYDPESLAALEADLHKEITVSRAYECVLRVRCSVGWKIDKLYGPVRVMDGGLLVMGALGRDATFAFTLARSDDGDRASVNARRMCVQVCMAYTNAAGQRSLRVQTQRFEVHQDVGAVNAGPMMCIVAHRAIVAAQANNSVADATQYIQTVASATQREQMRSARAPQRAEGWSLLLYYLFGLLRSPAFLRTCPVDTRLRYWAKLTTVPSASVLGMVAPSLWAVDDIEQAAPLQLSSTSVDSARSYLMFDGVEWLLWNGVHCAQPCDVSTDHRTESGSAVLQFIADAHRGWLADRGPLYTIAQGSEPTNPWEYVFFAGLLEDAGSTPETKLRFGDWCANLANRMTCSLR